MRRPHRSIGPIFAMISGLATAAVSATVALDPSAPLTPAMASQLSQNVNRAVIVIMKNPLSGADAANDQAPVMSELGQVGAQRVKPFHMVNALAAIVSDGEAERLKVNPAVAQVVPDVVIHHKSRTAAAKSESHPTSLPLNVIPGACASNGSVQLEPEALLTTNTDSDDPLAQTARSLGFTGAGVKVAYIADGVDPKNINFIRRDGSSAFIDYKDFSGDGPGRQTDGGEAFLDSNSIAGQGIAVYNVNAFSTQPDPGACKIRIEGVAPGASLVGLDVFGTFEDTTQSNFLQAIEYAVTVDHVDVLNESFGGNDFPDITSMDVTKEFNDAAIAAGVTVTVSTGDAGPTNTIGSPSTDPAVISAGATTTFQLYAQTNLGAARYFASSGWLDDNISALSSGGFSETGATVDLVAPGDSNWTSCDASALFSDCTNFLGQPSVVQATGGTSESAPLTAGAAALVIEAYRKSHGGASPSPALIKQILISTATDLGTPASQQGAGNINTFKAVLLAETIDARSSRSGPAAFGQALLLNPTQLNAVAAPGTTQDWSVTVTNPSAVGQFVQVSGRSFGAQQHVQKGSVQLKDKTSPQFIDQSGFQNNYEIINFEVAPGEDLLNASIAYPGNPANGLTVAQLSLIDPLGRFSASSVPQGVGNFGSVSVRSPAAGKWTGIIYGITAAEKGINGTVPWQASTQRFAPFGSVSPSRFFLAAGATETVHVTAKTPSAPGDDAGSIVLTSSGGGFDNYVGVESNSIPVTLRSLVDLTHGGAFAGVLTGGNGRAPGVGQVAYYEFNVPTGHESITANVSLTNDAGDPVGAYLINPDGVAVGFGQNSATGPNTLALTANTLNPVAGTWTLIVDFAEPVVGNEISQPFTGNILLDDVKASASGLPDSLFTMLPTGVPVTVPVRITNTGAAPNAYFIDARLNTVSATTLASLSPPPSSNGYPLPLGSTSSTATPVWLVPTETSGVQASANATLPVEFDFSPFPGDPDVFGAPTSSTTAAGSYAPAGGVVEPGIWTASPDEIGPFATPAPAGFVNMSMVATTKAFDPAVTSPTGDLWLASVDPSALGSFNPVVVKPGASVVVNVTITPTGTPGSVVSGTLYIDDAMGAVPPYSQTTGNEVTAIPYSYTVK
jgi:hypothetical protein